MPKDNRKVPSLPKEKLEQAAALHDQISGRAKLNMMLSSAFFLISLYLNFSRDERPYPWLDYIISGIFTFLFGHSTLVYSMKSTEPNPVDFLHEEPAYLHSALMKKTDLSYSFILISALGLSDVSYSVFPFGSHYLTYSIFTAASSVIGDVKERFLDEKAKNKTIKKEKIYRKIGENLQTSFDRLRFRGKSLKEHISVSSSVLGVLIAPPKFSEDQRMIFEILQEHFAQFGIFAKMIEDEPHLGLATSALANPRFLIDGDLVDSLELEDFVKNVFYAKAVIDFFSSLKNKQLQIVREGNEFVISGFSEEPVFPVLSSFSAVSATAEDSWNLRLNWKDERLFDALNQYRLEQSKVPSRGMYEGSAPALPKREEVFEGQEEVVDKRPRGAPGQKVKTRKNLPAVPSDDSVPEPVLSFGEHGEYNSVVNDSSDPTQIKKLEFSERGANFVIYVCATEKIAGMFEPGAWENLQVTSEKGKLEKWLSLDINGKREHCGKPIWATVCKHQQHHIISTEAFELRFPPNTPRQPRSFFVVLNETTRASLVKDRAAAKLQSMDVDYRQVAVPGFGRK